MKTTLPSRYAALLLLAATLTGCIRYQYATVSSRLPQNDAGEFMAENDSVLLRYNFNGYHAPVNLVVHNKLDTALYIDWKKSAIIIGDKARSYWEDKATIEASSDWNDPRWKDYSFSGQTAINGTLTRPESVSFIPPHASKEISLLKLKEKVVLDAHAVAGREKTSTPGAGSTVYRFERATSPLVYRSYISFSTRADLATTLVMDSEFWVSRVEQNYTRPGSFLSAPRGDIFYTAAPTGTGIALGATALALPMVLFVGLAATQF